MNKGNVNSRGEGRGPAPGPPKCDADGLPVPVMRTVSVTETRVEASAAPEHTRKENRMPPDMKLPPAMQRAADAPPGARVMIGGIDDVTVRRPGDRDAIGLDRLILRPQVSGTSDSARRRSLERMIEDVLPVLRG